jgi:hypothetical protein
MERVPLVNRWVSEKWQPATVVAVGAPAVNLEVTPGAPQLLHDTPDGTQWRFPRCPVELHPSEAEGYYLNLSSPQPRAFIMWRMFDDAEAPVARPVVVTLSYNEAARMMDGGEQVDSVALPMPLQEMLMPYVEAHYKPEPKKKVRRNDPFATDEGRDPRAPRGDTDKARGT